MFTGPQPICSGECVCCLTDTSSPTSALEILGMIYWDVTIEQLASLDCKYSVLTEDEDIVERLKIEAQYSDLVEEQSEEVDAMRRDQALVIPHNFDYYRCCIRVPGVLLLHP